MADAQAGNHSGRPVSPALDPCCLESARRDLRRHRDVATCDRCRRLLLAYGNDRDYDETQRALTAQRATWATSRVGTLRVISKTRAERPARVRGGQPTG